MEERNPWTEPDNGVGVGPTYPASHFDLFEMREDLRFILKRCNEVHSATVDRDGVRTALRLMGIDGELEQLDTCGQGRRNFLVTFRPTEKGTAHAITLLGVDSIWIPWGKGPGPKSKARFLVQPLNQDHREASMTGEITLYDVPSIGYKSSDQLYAALDTALGIKGLELKGARYLWNKFVGRREERSHSIILSVFPKAAIREWQESGHDPLEVKGDQIQWLSAMEVRNRVCRRCFQPGHTQWRCDKVKKTKQRSRKASKPAQQEEKKEERVSRKLDYNLSDSDEEKEAKAQRAAKSMRKKAADFFSQGSWADQMEKDGGGDGEAAPEDMVEGPPDTQPDSELPGNGTPPPGIPEAVVRDVSSLPPHPVDGSSSSSNVSPGGEPLSLPSPLPLSTEEPVGGECKREIVDLLTQLERDLEATPMDMEAPVAPSGDVPPAAPCSPHGPVEPPSETPVGEHAPPPPVSADAVVVSALPPLPDSDEEDLTNRSDGETQEVLLCTQEISMEDLEIGSRGGDASPVPQPSSKKRKGPTSVTPARGQPTRVNPEAAALPEVADTPVGTATPPIIPAGLVAGRTRSQKSQAAAAKQTSGKKKKSSGKKKKARNQ